MPWLTRAGSAAAVGLAATLTLTSLSAQQAQSATAPTPGDGGPRRSFEVASVKQNTAGSNRVMLGLQPGGRFNAVGVPLRLLIRNAFRVQDAQLVGLPDWTRSEAFDIVAKAEDPNPTPEMMSEMMQSLLMDRFKLVVHRETRELPVYNLMLAREDGRLGPKLTKVDTNCAAARGRGRGGPGGPGGPGVASIPLGRGAVPGRGGPGAPPPPCSMFMAPGALRASGGSMQQLANTLEMQAGRIVHDKTGLTGEYDIDLTFAPEAMGGRGVDAAAADPNAPSLFAALQEQLGLKLESSRAPIEVVVVDRVERPTPD